MENQKRQILDIIKKVAAEIEGDLAPMPDGSDRIACAHIYWTIKNLCGVTYSKADPAKVVSIVEAIRTNPNGELLEIFQAAKKYYLQAKTASDDSVN